MGETSPDVCIWGLGFQENIWRCIRDLAADFGGDFLGSFFIFCVFVSLWKSKVKYAHVKFSQWILCFQGLFMYISISLIFLWNLLYIYIYICEGLSRTGYCPMGSNRAGLGRLIPFTLNCPATWLHPSFLKNISTDKNIIVCCPATVDCTVTRLDLPGQSIGYYPLAWLRWCRGLARWESCRRVVAVAVTWKLSL